MAWLSGGGLAIVCGVAVTGWVLSRADNGAAALNSMVLIVPALLYVLLGVRVLIRVTGRDPDLPVRQLCVVTLGTTAAVALLGSLLFLFALALTGSSMTHEGGDPGLGEPILLLGLAASATISAIFVLAARTAKRIDDRPRSDR